jgi:hypothetical protein
VSRVRTGEHRHELREGHPLRLPVLPDLEVGRGQVGDDTTVPVGHDRIKAYGIDADAEARRIGSLTGGEGRKQEHRGQSGERRGDDNCHVALQHASLHSHRTMSRRNVNYDASAGRSRAAAGKNPSEGQPKGTFRLEVFFWSAIQTDIATA